MAIAACLRAFGSSKREEKEMWAVAALKRVRGVLRTCCGARWSARSSVGAEGRCGRVRRRGEQLCGGVKRATTRFEFPRLRRANGDAVDVLRQRAGGAGCRRLDGDRPAELLRQVAMTFCPSA